MPTHTPEEIQKQILALAQQGQNIQAPQLNTGLLAQGQQGFSDVLTNPDQAQVNALIGGVAGALNAPTRGQAVGRGLVGALQQFGQQRQAEFQAGQQAAEFKRQQLQDRIQNLQKAGELGISTENLRLGQAEFGLQASSRDSVDLLTPDGAFVGTAVQGPQGRLFEFDEQGDPRDISAEIQQRGLRVAPAGRPQQTTNIQMPSEKARNVFNESFIKRVQEETPLIEQNQTALMNARRSEEIAQQALTGTGAQSIADVKSLTKTLLMSVGMDDLASQIETAPEEKLAATAVASLEPFVQAQSKSFSDADRENYMKGIPSIRNSREANLFMSRVNQSAALNAIDKGLFENQIAGLLSRPGSEVKDPGHVQAAFNAYRRDLPRTKPTERGIPQVIDDGQQLWKYYVTGRPKTWSVVVPESGEVESLSISQLEREAREAGVSTRELLAELDRRGMIRGVNR